METPFSCWDVRYATPFQAVIQQLASNKGRNGRGCVILQLIEQASLGSSLGSGCLGGGESVEDERCE